MDLFPRLYEAKKRERIAKNVPQFRSIRETFNKEKVPRIILEFAYKVKATGDIIILQDLESTPASKFPPSKYTKLYESAKVQVISFAVLHRKNISQF